MGKSVNETRLLDNRVQLETHFVVFVGLLGEGKCDICLLDTCVATVHVVPTVGGESCDSCFVWVVDKRHTSFLL